MTDMPEEIFVFRSMLSNGDIIFSAEEKNEKYAGTRKYIRSEKHEELKAIVEKMDSLFEYCEFMMSNAGLDCLPIYNVRTEYNKYKGDINEV